MRISLVGYMGSGKSTIGIKLAEKMNYQYLDIDQMIEMKEGKSVHLIFEQYGEFYFRKIEKKCLDEALKFDDVVISLGGGTPCFYNSMKLINKQSLSFYLKVSGSQLMARLWSEKEQRPLISKLSESELKVFVDKHLAFREKYYSQANHIMKNEEIDVTIESIMSISIKNL